MSLTGKPEERMSDSASHRDSELESAPSCTPVKRLARSPSSKARVMIKNRRKRYLDLHPDYFSSPSLELADPLSYDRLIRRFQTSSEREAEGRKKGYSGILEADLWRSEAKIDALSNPNHAASMRYSRDASGEILAEEQDEVPMNKEEGLHRWHQEMELMFLRGDDPDFDYAVVDDSEEYDDRGTQEKENEERWFDDEEPQWIEHDNANQDNEPSGFMTGQTGVQDF